MRIAKQIRKRSRISLRRIIFIATNGGLDQSPQGLTVARLARIKCKEGYTALHYAARFGHLNEIRGGVTVAQLAKTRSDIDWIIEYDVGTGKSNTQIFSGVTALSVATTFGHLDQIKDTVTLAKLHAAKDVVGRSALDALHELIREGSDPVALGNNVCACPKILELLTANNSTHVTAVRHAISRNRKLELLLTPEMTAALL